jgi:hypothetical protein
MGSSVRLASAMDRVGNVLRLYDVTSQETIVRPAAALLDEDFAGAGHPSAFPTSPATGYAWVSKVATGTVGVVPNFPGGACACALTSATGAQEALLYSGDQLNWDATKSATFETRLAMSVLPTGIAEAIGGFEPLGMPSRTAWQPMLIFSYSEMVW